MTIFHTLVFIYNSLDTQNHSLLLIEFIAEKIGVDHMFYSTVQCNRLLLSGYWKESGFWKYTDCIGQVP